MSKLVCLFLLAVVYTAQAVRHESQPTLSADPQSVSYLEILSRAQVQGNWTSADAERGRYNITFDPSSPQIGQNVVVHITFNAGAPVDPAGTATGINLKLSVKAAILEATDLLTIAPSQCGAAVGAVAAPASACQCLGFQHATLCPSDPSHCCCGSFVRGPVSPSVVPRGTLPYASAVMSSLPIVSTCACGDVVVNSFCPQSPSHCCCKSWVAPEMQPDVSACSCHAVVQITLCAQDPSHCCCSSYVASTTTVSSGSMYPTSSPAMIPAKIEGDASGSDVQTTIVSNAGASTSYAPSSSSNMVPVKVEQGSDIQTTVVTNPGGSTTKPSGPYSITPQYNFLQEKAEVTQQADKKIKRSKRGRRQPVQCDHPRMYSACGSACQSSCANPSPTCGLPCVSGCFCPPDRPIFHNGVCVTSLGCPAVAQNVSYNETMLVNSHTGNAARGQTFLTKDGQPRQAPEPSAPANFSTVVGYDQDGKALHQVLVVSPTSACACQRWAQANGYTYTPPNPSAAKVFDSADVYGMGSPCACEHAYNFDTLRFTEQKSKSHTAGFSRLLEFLELADKSAQKISEKSQLIPLNELSLVVLLDGPSRDWTLTIARDMYEKYLSRGSALRVSAQVSDATSGKSYYQGTADVTLQPPALRVFASCNNVTQGTPFLVYASFTNPLSVPLTNVRVTASSTGFQAQSLRYVSSIPPGQNVALQTNPLTIAAAVQHSIVITVTSCQLPKLSAATTVNVRGSLVAGALCNDVKP